MKSRNNEIRGFILERLRENPDGVTPATVRRFKINRRTVVDYLQELTKEGLITAQGRTKGRTYRLRTLLERSWLVPIAADTEEHRVWRETVAPLIVGLKENVRAICEHGFKEMLNNVIDHSGADEARIEFRGDAACIELLIADVGVGIFEKIRAALNLADPREALLELSKGRFTTAPERHSGEGIFFSSRMFDRFLIDSRGLVYVAKESKHDDWLFEMKEGESAAGTAVRMEISPFSKRAAQEVFDRFSGAEAGFFRTHVPVALAKYDQDKLVSRSQARRVLARFEKFREVILDFDGVESIGQPFADEIFRVFKNDHPEIKLLHIGAAPAVAKMIAWVQGGKGQGPLV